MDHRINHYTTVTAKNPNHHILKTVKMGSPIIDDDDNDGITCGRPSDDENDDDDKLPVAGDLMMKMMMINYLWQAI